MTAKLCICTRRELRTAIYILSSLHKSHRVYEFEKHRARNYKYAPCEKAFEKHLDSILRECDEHYAVVIVTMYILTGSVRIIDLLQHKYLADKDNMLILTDTDAKLHKIEKLNKERMPMQFKKDPRQKQLIF